MSSEGQRELQAAQSFRETRGRARNTPVLDVLSATSLPELEEMWLQGSGVPYEPGALESAPSDYSDFEFSSSEDDSPGPRVGGERFRIDRPLPARAAFSPGAPVEGPQGGALREIARVGRFPVMAAGERFRVSEPRQVGSLRERPEFPILPLPAPFRRSASAPSRPSAPAPVERPTTGLERAREVQARERLPTAFERIDRGFLDDD